MIMKLDIQHRKLNLYKTYINGDPGLIMSYFMARSNLIVFAFGLGKNVTKSLNGGNPVCLTLCFRLSGILPNLCFFKKPTCVKNCMDVDGCYGYRK